MAPFAAALAPPFAAIACRSVSDGPVAPISQLHHRHQLAHDTRFGSSNRAEIAPRAWIARSR
jgi:hypothetical protein